ncbi:MAG: FAD:protein FMN transferase [Planctomycetales bacterium]|nr:FAD:protein FMN transferase [Planctomycetales bacterium]
MGTKFEIIAYCDDAEKCSRAMDEAFKVVADLDAKLSNYKADSELNRFCAGAPHSQPVPISDDLLDVLRRSQEISEKTNGAFDVTIGQLSKLWRRAQRRKQLPSADRIADALASVGYKTIKLDPERHTASLTVANAQIDLGGIAKGYAINKALGELKKLGIERALVNGGGDVAVGVAPPGRDAWQVQVYDGSNDRIVILSLANQAVATSGNLYQFVEVDGKTYSHLVDPKTGIGLTTFVSSSVIAPDATSADAWASAIALVGAKEGLRLIESMPEFEATIRSREGNSIDRLTTTGFSVYESLVPADAKNKRSE